MSFGIVPPLSAEAVTAIAQAAAVAKVPPFSNVTPKAEGGSPALGSTQMIPYADHVHPRLTATAKGTLDANGSATVTFTQVFDNEPAVTVTSIGVKASGKPVPRFDVTFIMGAAGTPDAGKYTGATIYGERQRPLPTQAQTSPLAILGTVTGALNTLASSLSGFLPTEPAAGAGFSLIAVKTSAGT
jgi:hypothetical protein